MLDTNEFQKAKKRVFDERSSLSDDSSILESYVNDLELVCINERSFELAEILRELIERTESIASLEMQFKFLTLYFQQIYRYMQNLNMIKKVIKKMETITKQTQNVEHIAYTSLSKSIMHRIIGSIDDSNKHIRRALKTISTAREKYPDAYHMILYTSSVFFLDKRTKQEVVENVKTCVNYWYLNQNTLSMIMGIILLLRSYVILRNEHKFNELISWIFSEAKIQDQVLDNHFTILYSFVGRVYAIKTQLPEAIKYLQEAYNRVKQTKSQEKLMYEFIDIQKFLCRSYAFIGRYEESYEILINFLNFLESDFVRKNYHKDRIKAQYFSAYYTLLFIFVQLDVNISNIDDEKLIRIHNYAKDLIEQSRISRYLLLNTTLDQKEVDKIDKEKSLRPDELYLNLYQQLVSLETYSADEKTIDNIELIRDYVFNPLYADIVIGKIHFSMGNFEKFNNIVERLNEQINKADTPFLLLWVQLFSLLSQFLEYPDNTNLIVEIQGLENHCRDNKFFKMADEINLYWKILQTSITVETQRDRFQQTAFLDLYDIQSREMVIEILDKKESQDDN